MSQPRDVSETLSTAIEAVLDQVPFGRWLGLELTAIEDERVVMTFGMREEFVGNPARNILHGGVISSVLDTVGGFAALLGVLTQTPQAADTAAAYNATFAEP